MSLLISSDESVVLTGFSDHGYGCGPVRPNSIMGALATAMLLMGEWGYSYEYLMGVSGLAFRVQFYDRPLHGSCPSSPHAAVGLDLTTKAFAALPFELVALREEAEVRGEIDAGRPCLVNHFETDLAVGYSRKDDKILVRSYWQGGKGLSPMGEERFGFWSFGSRKPLPLRDQVVRDSIVHGLEVAKATRAGDYAVGKEAYRVWRERLAEEDWLANATQSDRDGWQHANAYLYDCLIDARESAAIFLETESRGVSMQEARAMREAAFLFRRMIQVLGVEFCCSVAPYAFLMVEGEEWSRTQREDQIRRLEQAERLEEEALLVLGAFLPKTVTELI